MPKVTLHILQTVDARIDGDFFSIPETLALARESAGIRERLGWDCIVYGATTVREIFPGGTQAKVDADPVPSGDHVIGAAERWIAVVDPDGTCAFSSPVSTRRGMEGARFVALVNAATREGYLAYLRDAGVSYLICGGESFSASIALEKLERLCGVRQVLLMGGGVADATFAAERCIDEMSLVIVPSAEVGRNVPTLFEPLPGMDIRPLELALLSCEAIGEGGVWLRYAVRD